MAEENKNAAEEPGKRKILQKLHAMMQQVGFIQHDAQHPQYRYLSERAIKEKVHAAMVTAGVVLTTDDESVEILPFATSGGKPQFLATVCVKWTLWDIDSGESLVGRYHGQGSDGMDKALYKAYTGGIKYFWRNQLQIATGDDPEKASPGEAQAAVAAKKLGDLSGKAADRASESFDLKKMIAAISAEKNALKMHHPEGNEAGEREYYDVLSKFGAQHANSKAFMSNKSAASECWKKLRAAVTAHKQHALLMISDDDVGF
jgi:hypothetical protein